MYKGPMDKENVGVGGMSDWIWEVGVGRLQESDGGIMGTIVIEQQLKKKIVL